MTIGKLAVILGLDSKGFTGGMGKANKAATGFSQSIKRAGMAAAKFVASLAGVATAVAGAAAAYTKWVVATTEAVVADADFADRIGENVNVMRAWKSAAEEAGVAGKSLEVSWQRMTKRIGYAAEGRGPVKTFEALGLSARRLMQLSPAEQFEEIAIAIGRIGDQETRVAFAADIFDSEGVALVQMMGDAFDGTRESVQRYLETHDQLTDRDVDNAREAAAAAQHLEEQWKNTWEQMALDNADAATSMIDSQHRIANSLSGLGKVAGLVLADVAEAFAWIAGGEVPVPDIVGVTTPEQRAEAARRREKERQRAFDESFIRFQPETSVPGKAVGRLIERLRDLIEEQRERRREVETREFPRYQAAPLIEAGTQAAFQMRLARTRDNPLLDQQKKAVHELEQIDEKIEQYEQWLEEMLQLQRERRAPEVANFP